MNERIEQLAEQCWVHTNEPLFAAKSPHWEFNRQKFASLIVRDVMNLFGDERISLHYLEQPCCEDSVYLLQSKIKEHFGVEE